MFRAVSIMQEMSQEPVVHILPVDGWWMCSFSLFSPAVYVITYWPPYSGENPCSHDRNTVNTDKGPASEDPAVCYTGGPSRYPGQGLQAPRYYAVLGYTL